MADQTRDFRRNNLDAAASPYLRQHAANPVWWQPWDQASLAHARDSGTPIFVSVGYATCHWCHVMASEAFSDPASAETLNQSFVAIKVDREERPDIDHFLMQYLLALRGQGGWPLNVFLTHDLRPIVAFTYLPSQTRGTLPSFRTVTERVIEFLGENRDELPQFDLWQTTTSATGDTGEPGGVAEQTMTRIERLGRRVDRAAGGFGTGTKFPPHATLLFLLYSTAIYRDERAATIARTTLDAMARRGLHDHLQGGFFRYCVDREWTIPHFEKMLYDQAMLLWVYALAARVFEDSGYRETALGVVRCLAETFADGGGTFVSAHDADTNHIEGATYLWSDEALRAHDADGSLINRVFELAPGGNFEGAHHLIRRDSGPLDGAARELFDTLLAERRRRPQPAVDRKIVTAWNALAGIALLTAARALGEASLTERAWTLYAALEAANRVAPGEWARSSLDGDRSHGRFLEDHAAVLLFLTHLMEEDGAAERVARIDGEIAALEATIETFHDERGWTLGRAEDFDAVPADDLDSPTPSPVTLALLARTRRSLVAGRATDAIPMRDELYYDAHNIAALIAGGEFYLIEGPDLPPWETLPVNTIRARSARRVYCFRGACRPGLPSIWNPPPTV